MSETLRRPTLGALTLAPQVRGHTAATERFEGLDALRAGAMLLGVAYHAAFAYMPDIGPWYPVADAATSPYFVTLTSALHAFRMPLFFALAGWFSHLLLERRGAAGFLLERARRLLIPFAVALPLTWLADMTVRGWSRAAGAMDARYPFGAALRAVPLHLWFLEYLFLASAIAAAAWALPLRRAGRALARALDRALLVPERLVLLAVPLAVLRIVGDEPRPDLSFVPQFAALAELGAFYAFGFSLWAARRDTATLQRRGWAMAAAGLLLAAWVASSPMQWTAMGRAMSAAAAWLVTLGGFGAALRAKAPQGRLVRALVDASYWIYLVHYPLVMALHVAFAAAPLPAAGKYASVVLLTLAASLASALGIVRWTPLGRAIGARRPSSRTNGMPRSAPQTHATSSAREG